VSLGTPVVALSPSKNPLRKLRELIIARRLEAELKKARILELYLNVISDHQPRSSIPTRRRCSPARSSTRGSSIPRGRPAASYSGSN
jgi:hypothetical protein